MRRSGQLVEMERSLWGEEEDGPGCQRVHLGLSGGFAHEHLQMTRWIEAMGLKSRQESLFLLLQNLVVVERFALIHPLLVVIDGNRIPGAVTSKFLEGPVRTVKNTATAECRTVRGPF